MGLVGFFGGLFAGGAAVAGNGGDEGTEGGCLNTASGLCVRITSKPKTAAHVLIVAALVIALFSTAVSSNIIFSVIIAGGLGAEGWIVWKLYQKSKAAGDDA